MLILWFHCYAVCQTAFQLKSKDFFLQHRQKASLEPPAQLVVFILTQSPRFESGGKTGLSIFNDRGIIPNKQEKVLSSRVSGAEPVTLWAFYARTSSSNNQLSSLRSSEYFSVHMQSSFSSFFSRTNPPLRWCFSK